MVAGALGLRAPLLRDLLPGPMNVGGPKHYAPWPACLKKCACAGPHDVRMSRGGVWIVRASSRVSCSFSRSA